MAHKVGGSTIELSYMSPNEMVGEMDGALGQDGLFIQTEREISPGTLRTVRIHIPWVGRRLELRGKVIRTEKPAPARGFRLRLLDGAHDTLDELREFIVRFRSGAILEEAPGPGISAEQRISAMSPVLKVMLASKANAEERMILGRDPDPRVTEHLLKNPSISLEEVRRLAARLSLHQGHFTLIMRNGSWMGDETLRNTLAHNPRLPEFLVPTVLQTMPTAAIQRLLKSMNITAATKRAAQKILRKRCAAAGQS